MTQVAVSQGTEVVGAVQRCPKNHAPMPCPRKGWHRKYAFFSLVHGIYDFDFLASMCCQTVVRIMYRFRRRAILEPWRFGLLRFVAASVLARVDSCGSASPGGCSISISFKRVL